MEQECSSPRFSFLLLSSLPHLHLNNSSPVCVLLSRPHVVARPSVNPCHGAATRVPSPSSVFSSHTHTEAQRLVTLSRPKTAAYWTCLAPLDDNTDQNSSQSSGHFLPVQWKRNVTWSYAEK
ncbi:uncharacterized protein V6R79_019305 [Siganus canaliculatus]